MIKRKSMSKIVDLSDVKRKKKRELNRRKQIILDSLEKLIEKIIYSDLDNETITVLEKLIGPCNIIYQAILKLDKGNK